MKKRFGFVSNSSSSSFIIVTAGENHIFEQGDATVSDGDYISVNIEDFIKELEQARNNGAEKIDFYFGGGMD